MSTFSGKYHHGDLRQVLLTEGLALVGEKGPDSLSLRELARRVGVSAMAPYRHYPNKDSLLAAIAEDGFLQLTKQLGVIDESCCSGRTPLLQAGIAYVRFALGQPALFRLMFSTSRPGGHHPDLDAARGDSFGVLMQHIRPEAASDQRIAYAHGCWSLVHGLALLLLDGLLQIPEGVQPEHWLAQIISSTVDGRPEASVSPGVL